MKKHALINFVKFATVFAFVALAAGCSGLADVKNIESGSGESATIEIKIGSSSSARTISPYYEYIEQMTKIVFSGIQLDGSATYKKTWLGENSSDNSGASGVWISAYQKLQEDPIVKDIPLGTWEFSLECYKTDNANNEKLVCSGKTEKTLKRGNNGAINFSLENPAGSGSMEIKLSLDSLDSLAGLSLEKTYCVLPSDEEPKTNTAGIYSIKACLKELNGKIIETSEVLPLEVIQSTGSSESYSVSYKKEEIEAGSYIVSFMFYEKQSDTTTIGTEQTLLTTVSELVSVAPDIVTTGEMYIYSLNRSYNITYMYNDSISIMALIDPDSSLTSEVINCAWINSPVLDFTKADSVKLPGTKDIVIGKESGQGIFGYLLEGWYTDSTFTQKIEKIDGSENQEDIKVYGNFVKIQTTEENGYKAAYLGMKNPTTFTLEFTGETSGVSFPSDWESLIEWNSTNSAALLVSGSGFDVSVHAVKVPEDSPLVYARATVKGVPISGKSYSIGGNLKNGIVTALAEDQGTTYATMTSFTVPEGYTLIDSNAFSDCTNLETVTLPESCLNIYTSAFNGCPALATVTMLSTTPPTLDASVFPDSVTAIYVPAGETTDDSGTKSYLEVYQRATNWTSYSNYLKVLLSKAEVAKIAPDYQTATTITIPKSWGYTEIASDAFDECSKLEMLIFPETFDLDSNVGILSQFNNLNIKHGSNYYIIKDGKLQTSSLVFTREKLISYCSELYTQHNGTDDTYGGYMTLEIPSGSNVATDDNDSNDAYKYIKKLVIPDEYIAIGSYVFYDENSYKTVCTYLEEVTLPSGLKSIENHAFHKCTKLKSISIPSGVTEIGSWAFAYCYALTSITIPSGVTEIGSWAFVGCDGLTEVTIPETVTKIGESAFDNCSSLTSITLPSGLKTIGSAAFKATGLTSIEIPDGVTELSDNVLCGNLSLASIKLPKNLKKIGEYALSGNNMDTLCNEALTSIELPETLEEIGEGAFYCLYALESITIPASVKTIGYEAFYCDRDDKGLKTVTMLSTTPPVLGGSFVFPSEIKAIYVPAGETTYEGKQMSCLAVYQNAWTNSGCVDKLQVLLSKAEVAKIAPDYQTATTITIPESWGYTVIASDAFSECTALTTLTIPSSVLKIQAGAFASCTSLNDVSLACWGTCWQAGSFYIRYDNDKKQPSDGASENPHYYTNAEIAKFLKDTYANKEWSVGY